MLESLGLRLWDEALLERDGSGELALLTGLREFREHLGGELHITLVTQRRLQLRGHRDGRVRGGLAIDDLAARMATCESDAAVVVR